MVKKAILVILTATTISGFGVSFKQGEVACGQTPLGLPDCGGEYETIAECVTLCKLSECKCQETGTGTYACDSKYVYR